LKALCGIFRDGHQDQVTDGNRQIGADFDGRLGHRLQMRLHDREAGIALKWTLSGNQFVERDAQGI
jgi:hypothetical protein